MCVFGGFVLPIGAIFMISLNHWALPEDCMARSPELICFVCLLSNVE